MLDIHTLRLQQWSCQQPDSAEFQVLERIIMGRGAGEVVHVRNTPTSGVCKN